MKILGLDTGSKTIGVAVSDPLGWTIQGVITIKRDCYTKDIEAVTKICKEYGVETIVAGMPKNMNETIGSSGEMAKNLCEQVEESFDGKIEFWDEGLTTVTIHRAMLEANPSRAKRKKTIGRITATYIS